MKISDLKKLNIPEKPGVYYFIKGKEILYVGKATSLKDRVRSYFGPDLINTRGMLLVDMVARAEDLKWQETDSVLEALILEANEIKKIQPYYNTKEKDDKSFNYVCITRDEFPKVITKRGKDLDKSKFKKVFGPFTNGGQLREALKIVRKIFPFADDKTKNYYEFYQQINLAPSPEKKKEYLNNIRNIVLFFDGKKKSLISGLKKEMMQFAKNNEFERAGEIKRKIFALNHINDIALIKSDIISNKVSENAALNRGESLKEIDLKHREFSAPVSSFRIEAYDIAHMSGKNMVGVMTVVTDGEIDKNQYRKFIINSQDRSNDTGALKEVLTRRLEHTEWQYPKLIVVDGGVAQINATKKTLSEYGIMIPVVSVLKDERHRPKAVLGDKIYAQKFEREILLANGESHRFAISFHKKTRDKNFLK